MTISLTHSPTDRALLAALQLWAGAEEPALLLRLGHQRALALREMRKGTPIADPLETLRAAHRAQMAPDLSRVHYTWLVRALQEETAGVQRVAVTGLAKSHHTKLLGALHLDPKSLEPDQPPAPFAVQAAQSLWTERLVGDLPPSGIDLPVVQKLASLTERSLYRLARLTGLAKLSKVDNTATTVREGSRSHLHWFNEQNPSPTDERLIKVGVLDWQAAQTPKRHALASLGLTTWARLFVKVDEYRLRWILQHLPYPLAKRVRNLGTQPPAKVRAVLDWEAKLFDVACERLRLEGHWTLRPESSEGLRP